MYIEKPINVYKDGNRVLKIWPDNDSDSPREWDNLGITALFNNRYDLPNEAGLNSEDFSGWAEMEKYIRKELKAIAVLPVYMLDHSGISISTKPFSCPWDSGQIGFIYTTAEKVKEMGIKKANIEKALIGEIETYDIYLMGGVWGFTLEEVKTCKCCNQEVKKTLDSVWGFYSEDPLKELAGYIENIEKFKAAD
jgi:hypothetical protein